MQIDLQQCWKKVADLRKRVDGLEQKSDRKLSDCYTR